ncbi:MAG: sialate O-acetylesterase [Mangrovibacterium sp.]
MKERFFLMLIILLWGWGSPVNAKVTLPRLISDGMVLQRDAEIPVWGWASVGETIRITFNRETYLTIADSDKSWKVELKPMKAGGPYKMEIEGENQITIRDILIGDIWVCSGQSNMEFWMEQVKTKYAKEIATSTNPLICEFDVKPVYDFRSPRSDVKSEGWKQATPENVLQFTAVGYFYARSLFEKYRVPIGLIHASKGGTPAESWISEESLKAFPGYYQQIQKLKDSIWVKNIMEQDERRVRGWYAKVRSEDQGLADPGHPWYSNSVDIHNWDEMQVPGYWNKQGSKPSYGVVWCKKQVRIPSSLAGKKALLYLGKIIDEDQTYLNGVKIGGRQNRYLPRIFHVPEDLLKAGENMITVRIINKYDAGCFIADEPYFLEIEGKKISLEGKWKYKIGASLPVLERATQFFYKPVGLFNGVIAPVVNYRIKGVIWYQGEANTKNAVEYRSLFPALIADWRDQWNQGDFPFLFVQLSSYLPGAKEPSESKWAELREAQMMALSVPNTGMAVTIDIGEWNDVHPANKKDVGERLALAAGKVAYHENELVYSGPIYRSKRIEGKKVYLSFDHVGSGLATRDGKALHSFSIAGEDGKFVWAKAKIVGEQVLVWNNRVDHPVAVRYAWANNPEGANLCNREGLPASPFRTDIP